MDRLPQKVPHGNLLLHVGGFAEEDKRVMGECPDMAAIEKEAVREGLAQGVAGAVRDLLASSAGGRGGAGPDSGCSCGGRCGAGAAAACHLPATSLLNELPLPPIACRSIT